MPECPLKQTGFRSIKEYEALKLELWKKYEYNIDAYTDAKTEFIRKWTMEARRIYGDRYSGRVRDNDIERY